MTQVIARRAARRPICQAPSIALVDLATIFAIPNRRKITLNGGEDPRELGISQLVDLRPLVLLLGFGPEDLECFVVLALFNPGITSIGGIIVPAAEMHCSSA
jgi:hypothetical protein